jgi:poly(3-hydroxybutyrate) depolymerase
MIEYRASTAEAMPHQLFLPLMMNHIPSSMPISTVGQPPTLSIANIAGWRLGNDDTWYAFPANMPVIPAGAKVIVYFDGSGNGADDYDFSDGMAELHTPAGMVNVFPDTAGKAWLYAGDANTPENLRAQYEWGIGNFGF